MMYLALMQASSMDESQSILDVFTFELPDRHQELFIQLGKDLQAFTYFQNLPLELRLAVWRLGFPSPRPVYFDGYPMERYNMWYCQERNKLYNPFPITLRISRESRRETLSSYSILPRYPPSEYCFLSLPPLCFSPSR